MLDGTRIIGFSKASPTLKTKFNCRKFYSVSNAIPEKILNKCHFEVNLEVFFSLI